MTATVILPTTGSSDLSKAIDSVLRQTYPTICYVVVDGPDFFDDAADVVNQFDDERLKACFLPTNTGRDGYYGQRIMSAFVHCVNTPYTLFLDQDCEFDEDHVESMISKIEKDNLDWCYSLRKIIDKQGNYLFNDDCESLGKWRPVVEYNLVDNNCYCLKTNVAVSLSVVMHGGWGQDRVLYKVLNDHFPKFDCTGKYSLNYRLGGNDGSVSMEFFNKGNEISKKIYKGNFPWRTK